MKKYAVICTREEKYSSELTNLIDFYKECGFESIEVNVKAESMLEAYKNSVKKINPFNNDIIVFCHDDIEILLNPKQFNFVLEQKLLSKKVGFVGVAGSKILLPNACWWDYSSLSSGKGTGFVTHGDSLPKSTSTYYGPFGPACVLDGLFLACKGRLLKKVSLEHPDYLPYKWDFYDLHLTFQAHRLGFQNTTAPFFIKHSSSGLGAIEAGGEWNKNREAFIKKWRSILPAGDVPTIDFTENQRAKPKEATKDVSFIRRS